MDNRTANDLTRVFRATRALAEASLVVLGFAFAILAIGIPVASVVRSLYEGLSWLARLSGIPSASAEALVSIAAVAGGGMMTALFVKSVVRFFRRRGVRVGVSTRRTANAHLETREIAEAA